MQKEPLDITALDFDVDIPEAPEYDTYVPGDPYADNDGGFDPDIG